MKLQHVFTVGLLAFTLGCSRTDSNRHTGEAAETVSAPNVRKAEGEKGLIRIEPEMLRDLKITTRLSFDSLYDASWICARVTSKPYVKPLGKSCDKFIRNRACECRYMLS